ncbi:MAG TPA: hypothetical protein VFH27_10860, partial [Longimicrobiaceae bacterium]|nr:hypothetical protein [Longimicrobiaceae bacterium]
LVIEVGESLSSAGTKQGWCTVRADRGEERIQGVEFFRQSGGGPREAATVTFSDHRWRAEVDLDPKHISSIEPVVHLTDGSVIQPGPQSYDIDDTANVLGVVVSPDGQGTAVVRVRADTDTTAVEWRETGPGHESDTWIPGQPDETDHTWLLPETMAGLPALTQSETLRTGVVRGLNEGDPGPPWVFDVPPYVAPPAAAALVNAAAFGSVDGSCPYISAINSISWDVSGVDTLDHFVVVERAAHTSTEDVPAAGQDAWVNHNPNQNATYTVSAAERALTGNLSDRFPGSVREGVGSEPYFNYFVVVYHRDGLTARTEVARKLAGTVETGVSYCGASTDTPRYGGGITRIAPEV